VPLPVFRGGKNLKVAVVVVEFVLVFVVDVFVRGHPSPDFDGCDVTVVVDPPYARGGEWVASVEEV